MREVKGRGHSRPWWRHLCRRWGTNNVED